MNLHPTKILDNFFSESDLKFMVSMIQQDHRVHESRNLYGNSDRPDGVRYVAQNNSHQAIAEFLDRRLEGLLDQPATFNQIWSMIEYVPFEFHADWDFDNAPGKEIYYTILIPLETVNTRTIIANEAGDTNFFFEWKPRVKPISNHFSRDFFKQHLSHCAKDQMYYLSHHATFEWRRGSLLAFDRRRWHASDNFVANGLKSKEAILSFTHVDYRL